MRAINQQAKKVMDVLTEDIEGMDGHRTIDNTKGTFMPVHIERVNECGLGSIFSVAHYYEQNGDLMRNPDMEFIKDGDGEYYPISFWQGAPSIRDEAVRWREGEIVEVTPKVQAKLVTFANMWMKNIKDQQKLGNREERTK